MAREAVREIPREARGRVMPRRRVGRRANGKFTTWTLPPPAEEITPDLAARWMRDVFPRLSHFTALGYYRQALRPPRLRDELRLTLAGIAGDAAVIASACAKALATGCAVPMQLAPPFPPRRERARWLRDVIRYEERVPHGVRGVLRGALRRMERDMRAAREAS